MNLKDLGYFSKFVIYIQFTLVYLWSHPYVDAYD